MVNSDKKRLRSHNVIFMEGKANRQDENKLNAITFPTSKLTDTGQEPAHTGSAYIVDISESTSNEPMRRHTKSEVWGTIPIRRSQCIPDQQDAGKKIFVTRAASNPKICTPKAYTGTINSPEGKL